MLIRHSQNLRPPARPDTALGLAMKAAIERAQQTRETKGVRT